MKKAVLFLAVAALSGCYPKAGPLPAALSEGALAGALSKFPNENAQTLESGRELFSNNCDNCHDYPDIWVIDEPKWPAILKKMGKEANLKQEESDLVLHFILSARADARPVEAPEPAAPKKKK